MGTGTTLDGSLPGALAFALFLTGLLLWRAVRQPGRANRPCRPSWSGRSAVIAAEHAVAYVHRPVRLGADDRELLQAIRLGLSG
jgi:hypothetical protein